MWNYIDCCILGEKPHHSVCQDYCYHCCNDNTDCIVVCDGASSGIKSELGAKFISEFVANYFVDRFDQFWSGTLAEINKLLFDMHQLALVNLSDYVQSEGNPPIIIEEDSNRRIQNDELMKYSTTIQLVAIQAGSVLSYKVGNGTIACVIENKIHLMSPSDHTGYTKHFTYKRTVDTLVNGVLCKYSSIKPISGFYIMSDGVDFEDGLFHGNSLTLNNIHLINQLISVPEERKSVLLNYADTLSKKVTNTAHDDIAIAVLIDDDLIQRVDAIDDNILPTCMEPVRISAQENHHHGALSSKRISYKVIKRKHDTTVAIERLSESLSDYKQKQSGIERKTIILEDALTTLKKKIVLMNRLLIAIGIVNVLIIIATVLLLFGVI